MIDFVTLSDHLFNFGVMLATLAVLLFFPWKKSLWLFLSLNQKLETEEYQEQIEDSLPHWGWLVGLVSLVFVLSYASFREAAHLLIGGDEYVRASMGIDWWRTPYFATHDHIWLAGHFYVLGLLFGIFRDVELGVQITSLLGALLTAVFLALTARIAWKSTVAGLIAGILGGCHWLVLWMSINPVADIFFLPAMMAAFFLYLKGWEVLPDAEHPWKRQAYFAGAGACVGFGCMFRYEMWYVGIVFGAFLCVRFCERWFRDRFRWRYLLLLLSAALIAAYPLGHLISSYLTFGSPVAFLQTASDMNVETNEFYDFSTAIGKLLNYPKVLWMDHYLWLPLAIAGTLLALTRTRNNPAWHLSLATLAIFVFAVAISYKAGIGSNTRARYTMFLVLPLTALSAGPLVWLLSKRTGFYRFFLIPSIVLYVLVFFGYNVQFARQNYPNAWNIHPDDLEIVQRMTMEKSGYRPETLQNRGEPFPVVEKAGRNLYIYPSEEWILVPIIRYHARFPGQVFQANEPQALLGIAEWAPPSSHFLLRQPVPWDRLESLPAKLEKVDEYRRWELWRKR